MKKFTPGQKVFTRGFNMNCNTVVVETTFVDYVEHECFDCVTESDNMKCYSNTSGLFTNKAEVK